MPSRATPVAVQPRHDIQQYQHFLIQLQCALNKILKLNVIDHYKDMREAFDSVGNLLMDSFVHVESNDACKRHVIIIMWLLGEMMNSVHPVSLFSQKHNQSIYAYEVRSINRWHASVFSHLKSFRVVLREQSSVKRGQLDVATRGRLFICHAFWRFSVKFLMHLLSCFQTK